MATPSEPKPNQPQHGKTPRIIEHKMEASFAGPLPHPAILKQYDDLLPGSANRIITMAEREGDHRRGLEKTALDANVEGMRRSFQEGRLGQIFAAIVSLSFLAVGAYVAVHVQPSWVGGVLGSMGIGGIVASFIRGRSSVDNRSGNESTPSEPPQEALPARTTSEQP